MTANRFRGCDGFTTHAAANVGLRRVSMTIDPVALWCCRLPAVFAAHTRPLSNRLFTFPFFLISENTFSSGKYVVSPATHLTDSGRFGASVAVSSGEGKSSHHRIFRFDQLFDSREGARLFAVTQGWLQTCSPRTALC